MVLAAMRLRASLRTSRTPAIMDGDGSDDPIDLARILSPIVAGERDFVISFRLRGKRKVGGIGAHQALATVG